VFKAGFLSFILVCNSFFVIAADIAVLTAAIGDAYKPVVGVAIENKRKYCEKHGYDFICLEESLDSSRHPAWSKIKLCEKVLSIGKYQWVFWTDADSLFMDFATKLEEFIDEDYNFIVGRESTYVNTGQFFLKNSPESFDFLKDIYEMTEFIDTYGWWEQGSIVKLLEENEEYRAAAKLVSNRLFNSFYFSHRWAGKEEYYQRGDFIIHFVGVKDPVILASLLASYSRRARL